MNRSEQGEVNYPMLYGFPFICTVHTQVDCGGPGAAVVHSGGTLQVEPLLVCSDCNL